MRMRGAANVADVETGGVPCRAAGCRAHAGEHEHITLTPTLTLTQVSMKEMLQCFKDAHIEHIVNENTLDLIMSYCDKTGDGREIWGRYRGDTAEIQRRYSGDTAEIQRRYSGDIALRKEPPVWKTGDGEMPLRLTCSGVYWGVPSTT